MRVGCASVGSRRARRRARSPVAHAAARAPLQRRRAALPAPPRLLLQHPAPSSTQGAHRALLLGRVVAALVAGLAALSARLRLGRHAAKAAKAGAAKGGGRAEDGRGGGHLYRGCGVCGGQRESSRVGWQEGGRGGRTSLPPADRRAQALAAAPPRASPCMARACHRTAGARAGREGRPGRCRHVRVGDGAGMTRRQRPLQACYRVCHAPWAPRPPRAPPWGPPPPLQGEEAWVLERVPGGAVKCLAGGNRGIGAIHPGALASIMPACRRRAAAVPSSRGKL